MKYAEGASMNPEDSRSEEPPIKNETDPISEERERIEGEIRNIGASTIGAFLKFKRQEKNLTLDEIDLITHIGPRWTEAIEEGTWSIYPSMLYAKGHVRGYCEALGLPSELLLQHYSKEFITAFPEETFHPHPVLQVNQILQDSSLTSGGTTSGSSRFLFWILAGFLLLLTLLGGLKVWMDKAEKHHAEEKIHSSSMKAAPKQPTPAPSAATPSSSAPSAPMAPVTPSPTVSGSPQVSQPSPPVPNAGNQNQVGGSALTPPPSPVSPSGSLSGPSKAEPSKISEAAGGTPSAPSGQPLSAAKEPSPPFHILKVTALKDTYVAVKEGDGKARRYPLAKGKSKVFHSKTVFWISTKDGGAILLSLDGHALGPAGPDQKSIQHKKVVLRR